MPRYQLSDYTTIKCHKHTEFSIEQMSLPYNYCTYHMTKNGCIQLDPQQFHSKSVPETGTESCLPFSCLLFFITVSLFFIADTSLSCSTSDSLVLTIHHKC